MNMRGGGKVDAIVVAVPNDRCCRGIRALLFLSRAAWVLSIGFGFITLMVLETEGARVCIQEGQLEQDD